MKAGIYDEKGNLIYDKFSKEYLTLKCMPGLNFVADDDFFVNKSFDASIFDNTKFKIIDLRNTTISTAPSFYHCPVTESIHLPGTIKTLASKFCFQCEKLKELTMETGGNFKTVDNLLYDKDGEILYACPAAIKEIKLLSTTKAINPSVQFPAYKFIIVPEGTESFPISVFNSNNFWDSKVFLPKSLKKLEGTFDYSQRHRFIYEGNNPEIKEILARRERMMMSPGIYKITDEGKYEFLIDFDKLRKSNVLQLRDYCLENNISSPLRVILPFKFGFCNGAVLPLNYFNHCDLIEEVVVLHNSPFQFYNCKNIKKIIIDKDYEELELPECIFRNNINAEFISEDKQHTVKDGCLYEVDYSDSGAFTLTIANASAPVNLTLDDKTMGISAYAFDSVRHVKTVTAKSDISLDAYTFSNSTIEKIDMPNICAIGSCAFKNSLLDGDLVIKSKRLSLVEGAFNDCNFNNVFIYSDDVQVFPGTVESEKCNATIFVRNERKQRIVKNYIKAKGIKTISLDSLLETSASMNEINDILKGTYDENER